MAKKITELQAILDEEMSLKDAPIVKEVEITPVEVEVAPAKAKFPKKIKILEKKEINGYPVPGHRRIFTTKKVHPGMITDNIFIINFAVGGGLQYEVIES